MLRLLQGIFRVVSDCRSGPDREGHDHPLAPTRAARPPFFFLRKEKPRDETTGSPAASVGCCICPLASSGNGKEEQPKKAKWDSDLDIARRLKDDAGDFPFSIRTAEKRLTPQIKDGYHNIVRTFAVILARKQRLEIYTYLAQYSVTESIR